MRQLKKVSKMGKVRKKYQVLSSNRNLKLKSNNEVSLNIFVKNFLRFSSFFLFFVMTCSNFMGMDRSRITYTHSDEDNTNQNMQSGNDEPVYTLSEVEHDCKRSVLHFHANGDDCAKNKKFFCTGCEGCRLILSKGSIYILWFKYLLSFIVGGIVVAIINWYNSSNNSVDSEIKSREKRGSINRKRGREKKRSSMNRRRKK